MKDLMNGSRRSSDECPHCGQRMLLRHGVRLAPKQADIWDMIEHSGQLGVSDEVLVDVFFSNKPLRDAHNLLKVYVCHINDRMIEAGVKIAKDHKGRLYPYRVYPADENGEVRPGARALREVRPEALPGPVGV